ncbi:MAG TPA: glycoside hydrolase family 2 TIM barrel-domain containing protein [Hyalangium sp.]|nr:glycoside hydrolase family 2 TIM barrel-domain containing protein [Hyalangium sp.]
MLGPALALIVSYGLQQAEPPRPATPVPATRLQTRWAAQVKPERVLPEYPRPQMARRDWQNLNGPWSYAVTARDAERPASFEGRVLVPFPLESQLSGAGIWVSPEQRVWYRRTFTAPSRASGDRLLLHFGAVDWETTVYVNGKVVGEHRGGFDPFTFDITDALKGDSPEQELVVSVWDPTDSGQQPRGKQVQRPESIFYTSVTGIWQTVWLEPVPERHITALRIEPDLDHGEVRVTVTAPGAPLVTTVTVMDGERVVATQSGRTGEVPVVLKIRKPRKWSPTDPFLYRLRVRLKTGDEVESYVGMRSIAIRPDASGARRLFLNGEPIFQFGPLDQGWWPDGLYTAPTDEALAFDIEKTKELGFNVIRNHVKVEPARWYYHCDRLGMLVWQDMPSGDNKGAEGQSTFQHELRAMVDALRNHPSIIMWVPFNEGWGQHATQKHVEWLKAYDPKRLVNSASGWTDMQVGDVVDLHAYPGPGMPPPEAKRASVLGEFGGLGLPVEGHTWVDKGNWGYRSFTSIAEINKGYQELLDQLRLHIGDGLAAAIYTQTTDVEIEVNGVMTYDRAEVKLTPESIAANRRVYEKPPAIRHLVKAADRGRHEWKYTTTAPPEDWFKPDFNDGSWPVGPGGFGVKNNHFAPVGTAWQTPDIWLRRTFTLPSAAVTYPHLRIYHDDDAQVYLNGELIAEVSGSNANYAFIPLSAAARAVLKQGINTLAVHAHQNRGGQFIDVGLVEVVER